MNQWTTLTRPEGCCDCLLETHFQTESTRMKAFYGCAEAVNDRVAAEQRDDPACIVSGVVREYPDGHILREVMFFLPEAA